MKLKWLSAFLVLFVIVIAILADTGFLPSSIHNLYDFPNGDKLGHFLLMGLVSFVLNWTALVAHADPKPTSVIWKASLVFALVVTLEEFSQRFFPRRTFSLFDLASSYAGIGFSASLVWVLKKRTYSE